jgi:hypothetical protein
LSEVIVEKLRPIWSQCRYLKGDPNYVDNLLFKGALQVRPLAEAVLAKVKNRVGLG